ncbi:MAG TPA: hypothetical protein DD626_00690 [Clostridiales bacterium]|nr:hypothetical protein [Clostridiales bacterium]
MNEFDENNVQVQNDEAQTADNVESVDGKKFVHIDKSKRIFDIVYLALCSAFMLVMWCTGYNFLPLVADILAIVAGVFIFARMLAKSNVGLYMWISYMVCICGLFVFFLIWGAESFGKNLWYNFVIVLFPVLLATLVYLADKFIAKKAALKVTCAVCAFLMVGTAIVYVFFMNLRCRPTVESLQAGHDDYLASVKNKYNTKNDSPNVLVILMDDMAYSDISAYSYLASKVNGEGGTVTDSVNATINTPNIDSIADGGIMMDNFYSASPVCSPSRFSILTGRYSSRGYLDNVVFPSDIQSNPWSPTHFLNPYQFLNNVDGILGDEITFAEVLQAAGYNTGCIGKWNLGDYGEYLPTSQGFDYFYGSYYVNDMTPYNWVEDYVDESGNFHSKEVRTHKENLDQSESTRLLTAQMLNFISSSVENDEKFLAYYTTPWPHYPIYSDNSGSGKGNTSDDTYVQCIEEFDKYLGDILNYLKNTPDPSGNGSLYDNTLVVFTSDNGPGREGVTGDMRGRKNTTFEGGMKVPMLVSYPNGGVGSGDAIATETYNYYQWENNSEPTSQENVASKVKSSVATSATTKHIDASSMNFDLFNTILSYCGITNEDGSVYLPSDRIIDGVDLTSLWNCTVPTSTRVHKKLFYLKKGKCQAVQMAVELDGTTYDFKYYDSVRTENSAFIDQVYKNYLFNLDTDPAEGYSVSKTYPEIASTLLSELKAFRKEMKTNRRGIIK